MNSNSHSSIWGINKTLFVTLLLVAGLGVANAATFVSPTVAPPGNNPEAPITVNSTDQSKSGSLTLGSASAPNSKASLELAGTKGFLPPRLNTTARNTLQANGSPNASAIGLTIYNTDTHQLEQFDGTNWGSGAASSSSSGSGADIPAKAIMFFNLPSTAAATDCPAGWSEFSLADGRYPVGAKAGATVGPSGVVGTALGGPSGGLMENRNNVGAHTHSVPGLSVPGLSVPSLSVPGLSYYAATSWWYGQYGVRNDRSDVLAMSYNSAPTFSWSTTGAGVTGTGVTGAGTTGAGTTGSAGGAGTNSPYVQLLACQKN